MATSLSIGDAVLAYNHNDEDYDENKQSTEHIQIGLIKYIGYIDGYNNTTKYVGIELIESIENGHNGTINACQYFDCRQGYGMHTKITNVVRKLEAAEVTIKMQEIIILFTSRLDQYVQALSQRDEYIEQLKHKQRYLRELLNEAQSSTDKPPSNGLSKNRSTLTVPKRKSQRVHLMDKIDVSPLSPSQSIVSETEYSSVIPNNISNSSVKLRNIDKKSFVFKVTDSNKPSVIFSRSRLLQSASCKKSFGILTDNNDDNKEKQQNEGNIAIKEKKHIDKRKVFESDSEPTVTPETDWSDDDEYDDDNSCSDGYHINLFSPSNSTKCTSKLSSITPTTITSPMSNKYSNNKSLNLHSLIRNRNSKISQIHKSKSYLPPNSRSLHKSVSHDIETMPSGPPQQNYAFSHITCDEMEKQRKNMNQMTLSIPNLQYTFNKNPSQQPVGFQMVSNNASQSIISRRGSWNNGLISNYEMSQNMVNYQQHPQNVMNNLSPQQSQYLTSRQSSHLSPQHSPYSSYNNQYNGALNMNNNNNNNNPYHPQFQITHWTQHQ